ncbi:hypothetical protein [Anaerotardibacter muris]|uniref:hypothetical protein n=1 Tax=Anaerotardibacter muris TaxID=2941505 RepID=UPI00203D5EF5|nr:hypothetical protein [Anaerotardibacter muris]
MGESEQLKSDGSESTSFGKVALFWYTEQGIVGMAEPLEGVHVEDSGEFMGLNIGHFELWGLFESRFNTDDMYHYPRGRVIYCKRTRCYKVVCDPRLVRSLECCEKIRRAFALGAETAFDTDLHYRSSFQSPELAEYTKEELADPFDF